MSRTFSSRLTVERNLCGFFSEPCPVHSLRQCRSLVGPSTPSVPLCPSVSVCLSFPRYSTPSLTPNPSRKDLWKTGVPQSELESWARVRRLIGKQKVRFPLGPKTGVSDKDPDPV